MTDIKDNTIFIIPDNIKQQVLLEFSNTLNNVKIYTITQFIKEYLFDYQEDAIYYLMNRYKIKYEVALVYLKNIYFVEDKKYSKDKLDNLVQIKKDLNDNSLLIYNSLFKQKLKSTKIVFYNFQYIK